MTILAKKKFIVESLRFHIFFICRIKSCYDLKYKKSLLHMFKFLVIITRWVLSAGQWGKSLFLNSIIIYWLLLLHIAIESMVIWSKTALIKIELGRFRLKPNKSFCMLAQCLTIAIVFELFYGKTFTLRGPYWGCGWHP